MAKVIKIAEKSGFSCLADGCILNDAKGKFLEYIKATNFNLPPGTYTIIKGIVGALSNPIVYPLPALPVAEKSIDIGNMKITEHKSNAVTDKACIDVANGDYYINPAWEKTLTTPQLCFCQNHEIGHFFYYTQSKCDIWAEYNMLDMGYNPQQIALASHTTLCGTCKSKGPLEKLFDLNIPFESAMRRLGTDNRMLEASKVASLINSMNDMQMAQEGEND